MEGRGVSTESLKILIEYILTNTIKKIFLIFEQNLNLIKFKMFKNRLETNFFPTVTDIVRQRLLNQLNKRFEEKIQ